MSPGAILGNLCSLSLQTVSIFLYYNWAVYMRVSAPCNLEGTDHVSSFVFLMPALHSFVSSFFSLFIQQTFLVFSTYNELDKVLGTP